MDLHTPILLPDTLCKYMHEMRMNTLMSIFRYIYIHMHKRFDAFSCMLTNMCTFNMHHINLYTLQMLTHQVCVFTYACLIHASYTIACNICVPACLYHSYTSHANKHLIHTLQTHASAIASYTLHLTHKYASHMYLPITYDRPVV